MAGDPDQDRGLRLKWEVRRLEDPTGRHRACQTFVLDLQHDPYAVYAIEAYATACERLFPKLAAELREAVRKGGK